MFAAFHNVFNCIDPNKDSIPLRMFFNECQCLFAFLLVVSHRDTNKRVSGRHVYTELERIWRAPVNKISKHIATYLVIRLHRAFLVLVNIAKRSRYVVAIYCL